MEAIVPSQNGKPNPNGLTIKDLLVDENDVGSDNVTDFHTLVEVVKRALMKLPERERNIILLRYDVIKTVPNASSPEAAATPVEVPNVTV